MSSNGTDGAGDTEDPDDPAVVADQDADEEAFVPLGSEVGDVPDKLDTHAAIAAALHPPPAPHIPRALSKEARAFFDGAMYAYTDGDLPGARLSFLAVVALADPATAPAAMVFLGVIAYRRRDPPEARLWFTRAAAGPDPHWALVAAQELRRLG